MNKEYSAVLVQNEEGKFLCLRSIAGPLTGKAAFPGGKVKQGETPLQAAARELFEETGLVAFALRHINTYVHDVPGGTVWVGHYFAYVAHEKHAGQSPIVGEPDKVHEVFWLTQEELEAGPSYPEFVAAREWTI